MNILQTLIIGGVTSVVMPITVSMASTESKPATQYTIEANQQVLQS